MLLYSSLTERGRLSARAPLLWEVVKLWRVSSKAGVSGWKRFVSCSGACGVKLSGLLMSYDHLPTGGWRRRKQKKIDPAYGGRWDITCFPSLRKADGDSYSRGVLYNGEEGRALTTVLHMCSSSGFVALPWRGSNPPPS